MTVRFGRVKYLVILAGLIAWPLDAVYAQPLIQFPTSGNTGVRGIAPSGTLAPPPLASPPAGVGTIPVTPVSQLGSTAAPPGATLGLPAFDAFSTQPNAANMPPSLAPTFGANPAATSPIYPPPPAFGQAYPGYPAQPAVQYPGGQYPGGGVFGSGGPFCGSPATPLPTSEQYLKLLDDLRVRYTWIEGGTGRDVRIHDIDLAVTLNWPNFLHSGQALRISPGFAFHFWSGPSLPTSLADLPSRAYSAYVDLNWMSNPQLRHGAELSFTAGLYSDFTQTLTSDSMRFMGTGLGWFRVTEVTTIKMGVTYIDRNDLKLLPAAGIFWYPNEDIKFDLYFPRPRIAKRLWTVGNTDLWGYLGGEYGGGSWTIRRTNGNAGTSEQVDINDLRVFGGLEWLSGYYRVAGFIEAGYVFDRELVYKRNSPTNLKLEDAFMLRGGLSF